MRIAQIAPLAESVPPSYYGGTERVVSYLTEELVRQGHEVVLFASGDSRTAAKLVPCVEEALRQNRAIQDPLPYNILMLEMVRKRAHEFDILHFHIDALHFPLFRNLSSRIVTTLHGRLDLPGLKTFYQEFSDVALVSVSNHQRQPMPPVNWIGTVYHGLPAATCPFTPHPHGDYLAFLGRICPEKRVDRAIQIAKRAGVILKIAAKVDRIDATYFQEKICPLLDDPMVEFIGEITEVQKSDFLGNARALLFPIDWPEPFGLVMIEAMSSGTPVIAYRRGSVPEIIDHGLSGFIVNDEDEAVQAVRQVHSLDRRSVRKRFETRFSAERMAKEYLTIYHDMIRSVEETKRARWSSRMDAEVTES